MRRGRNRMALDAYLAANKSVRPATQRERIVVARLLGAIGSTEKIRAEQRNLDDEGLAILDLVVIDTRQRRGVERIS